MEAKSSCTCLLSAWRIDAKAGSDVDEFRAFDDEPPRVEVGGRAADDIGEVSSCGAREELEVVPCDAGRETPTLVPVG